MSVSLAKDLSSPGARAQQSVADVYRRVRSTLARAGRPDLVTQVQFSTVARHIGQPTDI